MERILFSPIGDTDPVRGFCDGACLHIIRHYKPQQVTLFFTKEMWEKEQEDHRYTQAINKVSPECNIEVIQTDIVDVHLYDSFITCLPDAVRELHDKHPEAEILINLSSGTPQIKTVMAILTVESDWCRGIQVSSPEKKSNRAVPAEGDCADVKDMLDNNLDDDPQAENRCSEPPLKVIRDYGEKNRILSLVDQYEYRGAWQLVKTNSNVPEITKKLLNHVICRMELQTTKAEKILSNYQGNTLFPWKGEQRKLIEYFLIMQINQNKKQLSELLVKITPFLYELLLFYFRENVTFALNKICETRGKKLVLTRGKMTHNLPELLAYLNRHYQEYGGFRDSELSSILLERICYFIDGAGYVKDVIRHKEVLTDLEMCHAILTLRNQAAHEIIDITEEKFKLRINMTSAELMNLFFHMLSKICGYDLSAQRGIYKHINEWIKGSLFL